jgi:hypothetical protein
MKKQLNDGFKMWGNYLQAIDEFTKGDDAKFGRFMRIICNYGIYGEELAETEIEKFFFTSVKKSIDASVTNIKNGKKGGAGNTSTTEKFIEPTLEEIKAYCEEIKAQIDPQEFLDHYQKNGWTYGKDNTPVKNWKACVRTWERNKKKWEINDTVHNKGDDVL